MIGWAVAPLEYVPGLSWLAEQFFAAQDGLSAWCNTHFFHIKHQTVQPNGNGDTTFEYGALCFNTLVASVGALAWTAFDRRRPHYATAAYWLVTAVRYFVAMQALSYGIIKLFRQQMLFPSTSELATPLGDLLPMRLAWFFIGYSEPYQFFSGAVELLAGVLLLWRRTATLGAVVATGVFLHVFVLNLCYDIPVKIFSGHLFALSVLALLADGRRLLDFFLLNRPTVPRHEPRLVRPWARGARLAGKGVFFVVAGVLPLRESYQQAYPAPAPGGAPAKPVLPAGYYEVTDFRGAVPDSLRWQNFVIDAETPARHARGSIQTPDTLFRQRYRRAYFTYVLDSARQLISFRKRDTVEVLAMHCDRPAPDLLRLRGLRRGDSLTVTLHHVPRHFQLAERQFHWRSETNR